MVLIELSDGSGQSSSSVGVGVGEADVEDIPPGVVVDEELADVVLD